MSQAGPAAADTSLEPPSSAEVGKGLVGRLRVVFFGSAFVFPVKQVLRVKTILRIYYSRY